MQAKKELSLTDFNPLMWDSQLTLDLEEAVSFLRCCLFFSSNLALRQEAFDCLFFGYLGSIHCFQRIFSRIIKKFMKERRAENGKSSVTILGKSAV